MKILVIDDAQLNVTLLQHLLKKLPDTQSIGFVEPQKALEWCKSNEPDLVVVDYIMPQLNGIEFSKQFRNIAGYTDIPVLMVTARREVSVRHEALASGVTDFLNKPFNINEFLARAKNMLALRTSHKQLADEVRKATAEIVARETETIFCLAQAAEYRNPEAGLHIRRVAHYSKHIARCMGLSPEQQELLLVAATMHDIGKVGIPDLILLKPGRLTEEEFSTMKQHTVIGHKILSDSHSPLLKVAAEIAYTHHEKFDGSGYPNGLVGMDIPLFGRIAAVADVFDALMIDRPYKKAWEVADAKQLLRDGAGTHFDPVCVEAFLSDWDTVIEIKNRFLDENIEVRNRVLE